MNYVVTLPASAKDPAAFSKAAKRAGAHLLEVRGDLTPKIRAFKSALPLLVSPRGTGLGLAAKYIDLELHERHDVPRGARLILSLHDYEKTPSVSALLKKVKRMQERKPWLIKIATTVRSERDLITLKTMSDTLRKKKIRAVVLGMGDKAHLTRVLSPLLNTLTYSYVDGWEPSAAGQLPLSFYALLTKRRKPKIFGILGGPHVTASLSPVIHNALFLRHRIDAVYSCFPTTDFTSTVSCLKKLGVTGYSVTAPFKYDAYALGKKREPLVQTLGVANTLVFRRGGVSTWLTDAAGIYDGYPKLRTCRSVAILGAGGAVPSAVYAVRKASPSCEITVFCRDTAKAKRSLRDASVDIRSLSHASHSTADALLCAVSQDVSLPLPKSRYAIDLRYGKETRFLADAKKKGMKTADGLSMLIHQALKQFRHFTGKTPFPDDAEYCARILRPLLPR